MTEFFKFPSTQHLACTTDARPRGDKLISREEEKKILAGEVVVEEKVDGANLGISVTPSGQIRAQNRGQYLFPPYLGQFSRLDLWLSLHESSFRNNLEAKIILFGEWCAAVHSLEYDRLPDWFLLFDVYDRDTAKFWSTRRRNKLAAQIGLQVVHEIYRGVTTREKLLSLIERENSHYANSKLEGVIVRQDDWDWNVRRAKLVRSEFTQALGEHWRSRKIRWNRGPSKFI